MPLYTHINVPDTPEQITRGIGEEKSIPSAAEIATLHPDWRRNIPCRNGLVVSVKEQRFDQRGNCAEDDRNFVALALSGGGSRAAVFSAQVMFELERYGVLQQADVVSSVSGGSYTAAFYALSCDKPGDRQCPETIEGPPRFAWNEDTVFSLLEQNFIRAWILNWFWPDNILRYWMTQYDRTDIMAETLADNLYDNSVLGNEGFRMQDLNPQRPSLVINATDNTFTTTAENVARHENALLGFTFTREQFSQLKSSLDRFPVANAVTASASFPGAFQYVTLRDFSKNSPAYRHLFDGGTSDNLGLRVLRGMIQEVRMDPKAGLLVILVDSYITPLGVSSGDPDPRSGLDYLVDLNFLDSYDTLMTELRLKSIREIRESLPGKDSDLAVFTFSDLEKIHPALFQVVTRVPTSLKIKKNDANCLRQAARILVERKIPELRKTHPGLNIPATADRPAATLPPCDTNAVD